MFREIRKVLDDLEWAFSDETNKKYFECKMTKEEEDKFMELRSNVDLDFTRAIINSRVFSADTIAKIIIAVENIKEVKVKIE